LRKNRLCSFKRFDFNLIVNLKKLLVIVLIVLGFVMGTIKELKNFVKEKFVDEKVIIASKSEPYSHFKHAGGIKEKKGADGLVTALDPVMQAIDGSWLAFGFADGDFELTDLKGRVRVPISSGKYTLRRIKLNEREKKAMVNIGPGSFWPLSHLSFYRPLFIRSDWEEYKRINKKVAEQILDEVGDKKAIIWLQDYHLVMCAKYLKEKNKNLTIGLFWHIPWPDWEIFVRCPWAGEAIDGLLHNDLLGFHIKQYCNNFVRCCEKTQESKIDRDYRAVSKGNLYSKIKDFPISINVDKFKRWAESFDNDYLEKIRDKYNIKNKIVALSVERFVYSKGIKEKILAVEELLNKRPNLIGKFVLLDFAKLTGSYSTLKEGLDYYNECKELMFKINKKYSNSKWQPIRIVEKQVSQKELAALYKLSRIGFIVPLHDGMNLVAKEYAVCQTNLDGVLILSEFTGSALELKDGAIIVNPFSTSDLVKALEKALDMPLSEKKWRNRILNDKIRGYNVYDWAKDFFKNLYIIKSEKELIKNVD